jgi:hypothetical protein
MISKLEDLINEADIAGFYDDEDDSLRKWYLGFLHEYVLLCVPDKADATRKMRDRVAPEDIFAHVSPEYEARTIAMVVNGHESWSQSMAEEPMVATGKRKRCVGRWTGNNPAANNTRLANCTAWDEQGLQFLDAALHFFEGLREHHGHAQYAQDAQGWYLSEVVARADNEARDAEARSKTRKMMRAEDKAADYSNRMGKWAPL